MPRFFFNVFAGESTIDREGVVLKDADHARNEAIKAASVILADETFELGVGEAWYMEVLDEEGDVLLNLDFAITTPHDYRHSPKPVRLSPSTRAARITM